MLIDIWSIIYISFFVLALYFKYSHDSDNEYLDQFLSGLDIKGLTQGKTIEKINDAVYSNKGFAKNKQYFIFRRLGATPLQVLEFGGDCADKSRLLAALLTRLNIESSLVMLYECECCRPTHTVVNAKYEFGWMVADPVFNIVFPKDNETYYGASELKKSPNILIERLDHLINIRGESDKIFFYKRDTESYNWPKTINWDKNSILKLVSQLLYNFDINPYLIKRPHMLENPKPLLMYLSLFSGLSVILIKYIASLN